MPSTFFKAFSTRATQEAQVIPSIASVPSKSLRSVESVMATSQLYMLVLSYSLNFTIMGRSSFSDSEQGFFCDIKNFVDSKI